MNLKFHSNVCQAYNQLQRKENPPTLSDILDLVCQRIDLTRKQITGTERLFKYVVGRHFFASLAREYTQAPLKKIGAAINRHHSTAIHSIKRSDAYMNTWPYYARAIRCLKDDLEGNPHDDFPQWPDPTKREKRAVKKHVDVIHIASKPEANERQVVSFDRDLNKKGYSYRSMHS